CSMVRRPHWLITRWVSTSMAARRCRIRIPNIAPVAPVTPTAIRVRRSLTAPPSSMLGDDVDEYGHALVAHRGEGALQHRPEFGRIADGSGGLDAERRRHRGEVRRGGVEVQADVGAGDVAASVGDATSPGNGPQSARR